VSTNNGGDNPLTKAECKMIIQMIICLIIASLMPLSVFRQWVCSKNGNQELVADGLWRALLFGAHLTFEQTRAQIGARGVLSLAGPLFDWKHRLVSSQHR
jgi:hypothetical protein